MDHSVIMSTPLICLLYMPLPNSDLLLVRQFWWFTYPAVFTLKQVSLSKFRFGLTLLFYYQRWKVLIEH